MYKSRIMNSFRAWEFIFSSSLPNSTQGQWNLLSAILYFLDNIWLSTILWTVKNLQAGLRSRFYIFYQYGGIIIIIIFIFLIMVSLEKLVFNPAVQVNRYELKEKWKQIEILSITMTWLMKVIIFVIMWKRYNCQR